MVSEFTREKFISLSGIGASWESAAYPDKQPRKEKLVAAEKVAKTLPEFTGEFTEWSVPAWLCNSINAGGAIHSGYGTPSADKGVSFFSHICNAPAPASYRQRPFLRCSILQRFAMIVVGA